MVIFRWNRELETGVEMLDRQHKQIFKHANHFFLCHKCGDDVGTLKECMGFLQQYTMYHFQAEEAFQVQCGYPRYREHQAIHNGLATQVKFLSVKMEASGYAREQVEAFYHFLSEWIRNHILVEDVGFARFFQESGASEMVK